MHLHKERGRLNLKYIQHNQGYISISQKNLSIGEDHGYKIILILNQTQILTHESQQVFWLKSLEKFYSCVQITLSMLEKIQQ
jgi:hypothetical protein